MLFGLRAGSCWQDFRIFSPPIFFAKVKYHQNLANRAKIGALRKYQRPVFPACISAHPCHFISVVGLTRSTEGMEIQTLSSRRPSSNAFGWNCRNHFRVAARRQTTANNSALFHSAALCRDAATWGKLPQGNPTSKRLWLVVVKGGHNLFEVANCSLPAPKVAQKQQPWALGATSLRL